jgi:hypothetical protein
MNATKRATTVEQPTRLPTRKMAASGTVGLVAFGVVTVADLAGWPVPEGVAFAVAGALMWAAGYITRERRPPANGLTEAQLERLAVRADYPDPGVPEQPSRRDGTTPEGEAVT